MIVGSGTPDIEGSFKQEASGEGACDTLACIRSHPDAQVAIHECGHAVLSFHHHRAVHCISIVPDDVDGSSGRVVASRKNDDWPGGKSTDWLYYFEHFRSRTWSRPRLERQVQILVSGVIAEARLLDLDATTFLLQEAREYQEALDLASFHLMARTPDKAAAFVERQWLKVAELMRSEMVWRTVCGMAAILLERRAIRGRRCRETYNQVRLQVLGQLRRGEDA